MRDTYVNSNQLHLFCWFGGGRIIAVANNKSLLNDPLKKSWFFVGQKLDLAARASQSAVAVSQMCRAGPKTPKGQFYSWFGSYLASWGSGFITMLVAPTVNGFGLCSNAICTYWLSQVWTTQAKCRFKNRKNGRAGAMLDNFTSTGAKAWFGRFLKSIDRDS